MPTSNKYYLNIVSTSFDSDEKIAIPLKESAVYSGEDKFYCFDGWIPPNSFIKNGEYYNDKMCLFWTREQWDRYVTRQGVKGLASLDAGRPCLCVREGIPSFAQVAAYCAWNTPITGKQITSLHRVMERHGKKGFNAGSCGDHIFLETEDGLYIGIEKDGYSHT